MGVVPLLNLEDRVVGCLLAGALGDAIGTHFEGKSPSVSFVLPQQLHISDDTQLTLATCEAILEGGAVKPEMVARHFLHWYRSRRLTGLGSSTLKSLRELEAGGHWALVGATGEQAAGNGAAMRIAPLAFLLNPNVDHERQTIRDICRITHRHDEAYLGALAIVRVIREVLAGKPLNNSILPGLITELPDSRVRDRLKLIYDYPLSISDYTTRHGATGYVVDSIPLAIHAALQSASPLETISEIVQCGGDTDTIAALYGQIYGAANGSSLLPQDILTRIDEIELIRETAARFARIVTR